MSELRLAKARTLKQANAVLSRYILRHNRRFAVPPADAMSAWRAVPRGLDPDCTCSFYYLATVLNDNTVRYGGAVIDIPPGPGGRSYAKGKVELRQFLDGSWRVYRSGAVIANQSATEVGELRAKKQRKRSPQHRGSSATR